MLIKLPEPESLVEAADIWARPKENGLGFHWGTGLSSGLIKDAMPETGKRLIPPDVFCDGKPCFRFRPERSADEKAAIELRAILNFPGAYNGLVDNCEHDMMQAQTGVATSPTVNFWGGLLIGVGLFLGVAKAIEPRREVRRKRRYTKRSR